MNLISIGKVEVMVKLPAHKFRGQTSRLTRTMLTLAELVNERKPTVAEMQEFALRAFGKCAFHTRESDNGLEWNSIEPARLPIVILYRHSYGEEMETLVYADNGWLGIFGGYPDDYVDGLVEMLITAMKR